MPEDEWLDAVEDDVLRKLELVGEEEDDPDDCNEISWRMTSSTVD